MPKHLVSEISCGGADRLIRSLIDILRPLELSAQESAGVRRDRDEGSPKYGDRKASGS